MPGPYLVRKSATVSTNKATPGNGLGSENPVPLEGMNAVVLLVDVNFAAAVTLTIEEEVSFSGGPYYHLVHVTPATFQIKLLKHNVAQSDIGSGDQQVAIKISALGDWMQISSSISASNAVVGIRAMTGVV